MTKTSLVLALVGALGLSAATPAFSQSFEIGRNGVRLVDPNAQSRSNNNSALADDSDDITRKDAIRIARGEGLREVDDVTLTRKAFRVVGTDRSGDDIRVDVDRFTGDVISVR